MSALDEVGQPSSSPVLLVVVLTKEWDYGVEDAELEGIPPKSEDQDLCDAIEAWADEVELYHAYPCIPVPGPSKPWVGLLKVLAKHGDAVKFPKELAERLKPWIPAAMWKSVVQE